MNAINISASKKRIKCTEHGICSSIQKRALCQDQLSLIVTKITEQFLTNNNADRHIQSVRQEILRKVKY